VSHPLGVLLLLVHLVDDDHVQCPDAPFQTIQDAVDAAAPGDTVKVCAGFYPENVLVEKPLRLLGARAGRDARKRRLDLSRESVVEATAPFRLSADDVTVDGFYIHELFIGEDEEEPGISTVEDFSGYVIRNNVFETTTIGLFPRSSGATEMVIRHNLFLGSIGIATGEIDGFGATHNTSIVENRLVDADMVFIGGGDVGVRIARNTIIGGGIHFSSVENVLVERNKFFRPPHTAISVANADRVIIRDNLLRDGESFGIAVAYATTDVQVVGNRIAGFQEAGIFLVGLFGDTFVSPSSDTLVADNEIEDGAVGISLLGAAHNVIRDNDIEDNTGVPEDDTGIGLQVDPLSFDNLIVGNEARGNTVWDCRDQSTGNATLGTANTWQDNEGSRSSPPGLCPDR
jgi:parallel beta-helix repeat protein